MRKMRVYLSRLFHIAGERRLWLTVLGKTGRQYIWLIRTSSEVNPNLPNLLVAAGFHGEEIAGPLAILKWLETVDDSLFKKANLTFLPCINPIGFNRGTRYARTGEKTNCGFCHPENGDKISVEGSILMENIDFLLASAKDGFLSLHEDDTVDKFYIYSLETFKQPGIFTRSMRDEEKKHFELIPDGTKVNEDNDLDAVVKDGIVYKLHDGTFEDYLFHNGVTRAITTETPSLGIGLERRVEANVSLITKFVNLSKRYCNE